MALPVAWLFARFPVTILCYDIVYSLHKGLSTNPQTGKTVKPPENLLHVTAQRFCRNFTDVPPKRRLPTPNLSPQYEENNLKDFL